MPRWKLAYYILRHFGLRIIRLRLGVYASKAFGLSRRKFAPRPWEEIELADICKSGVPVEAA